MKIRVRRFSGSIGRVLLAVMAVLASGIARPAAATQRDSAGPPGSIVVTEKQEETACSQGGAKWFKEYVDQPGDVGAYNSIAFDPGNGTPWISYYDATNTALKVALYVGSDGNCGPDNNWWCMTADNADSVGTYSSIDYYAGSFLDWKAGVAYYDATHGALKYAEYTCILFVCFWDVVTVQDAAYMGAPSYGQYASFKYNADGEPLIAFYASSNLFDDELNYAYRVASGGNCGVGDAAGLWHCETVDSGDGVGQYASLDYTEFAEVYIAYYDGGAGDLKYAYYSGIGNCGTGNTWSCATLDGTDGSDVGKFVSLHAPASADDALQLAYYDASHGMLRYAVRVDGSGGNCGPGNSFQCDAIEAVGGGPSKAVSLAADGCNVPIIAYLDDSQPFQPSQLRVAQPAYSLGLPSGNCGPGAPFTWQCTTVDAGSDDEDEAGYVSIALDPNGLAMVAYSAWAIPFDTYDLKIAYQRAMIFLPVVTKQH